MVLSTLIVGLALASPSLADLDQDDWRVSDEPAVLDQRPPEWPNPNFQLFSTCPSSQHRDHTLAEMTVTFTNSCEDVFTELQARAGSTSNGGAWVDPHNEGHYSVDAVEGNMLRTQRWTKKYKYEDLQTFSLEASSSGGCKMNACSVSQPNSNNSGGTDMCDMQNLFCNSATKNSDNGVACTPVKFNLSYKIDYLECGRYTGGGEYLQHKCQDFAQTCLRNPSTNSLELPAAAPPAAVVLEGRPPEWPANADLFSTCPSSQHRDHTMAEMTVDFTNSCEEVSAEIQARASSASDGGAWVDPHNRGHYKLLSTNGNLLTIQRWTGRYKYKDLVTFSMQTSGTGCKVNACAVSQPNSNNSGGTDMCDMGNLFCNSDVKNNQNGVACTDLKYKLSYTVPYLKCGRFTGGGQYLQHNCQDFTQTCLRNPTTRALATPEIAPAVLEGRPPEWPANANLFSTCPSSQHRDHTMAEMTVDFTNSCSEVSAEIQARAGSVQNGGTWQDPHNRGHYKVLAVEGNLIKAQRWTGRYKYKDLITFSLNESGTGCKVNACAVSQPNSNNSGGTCMCDMGNLFCNSDVKNSQNGVACKDVKYKLSYTVPFLQCGRYTGGGQYLQHNCQDFTTTCLRNAALMEPQHVLSYLFQ